MYERSFSFSYIGNNNNNNSFSCIDNNDDNNDNNNNYNNNNYNNINNNNNNNDKRYTRQCSLIAKLSWQVPEQVLEDEDDTRRFWNCAGPSFHCLQRRDACHL